MQVDLLCSSTGSLWWVSNLRKDRQIFQNLRENSKKEKEKELQRNDDSFEMKFE